MPGGAKSLLRPDKLIWVVAWHGLQALDKVGLHYSTGVTRQLSIYVHCTVLHHSCSVLVIKPRCNTPPMFYQYPKRTQKDLYVIRQGPTTPATWNRSFHHCSLSSVPPVYPCTCALHAHGRERGSLVRLPGYDLVSVLNSEATEDDATTRSSCPHGSDLNQAPPPSASRRLGRSRWQPGIDGKNWIDGSQYAFTKASYASMLFLHWATFKWSAVIRFGPYLTSTIPPDCLLF